MTAQPAVALPEQLRLGVERLPAKDRARFETALSALHEANGNLWAVEDLARDAELAAAELGAHKRRIDQLNHYRNQMIDRIDEALAALCRAECASADAPLHTETLGSALDRLSVLTLRLHHTRSTPGVADADARMPVLREQLDQLLDALDALAVDIREGRRRLPRSQKLKLYGRPSVTPSRPVAVSAHIDQVIAFGGLSECGKSSSADYLRHATGSYRFKIGFLLGTAAARAGIGDPYALPVERQAELLVGELGHFADAHAEARRYTIESIHSDRLIMAVKSLLGHRLTIVYLDAPFETRVARSGATAAAVAAKDEIKASRGAGEVARIADHVVDNDGSVTALRAMLRTIASPPGHLSLAVSAAANLALPAAVAGLLDAFAAAVASTAPTHLVAATGSAVTGAWISGWSDLDVMVIASNRYHEAVAGLADQFGTRLRNPPSVKVGLTLLTPGEVSARLIQPRVVHALRQIASATRPVLAASDDLVLPLLTDSDTHSAAEADLPLVIVTLRRLSCRREAADADLRATYKHIVLACRLLLRIRGIEAAEPDDIIGAAQNHLNGLGTLQLPTLSEIADAHVRADPAAVLPAVISGARHLLAWYQRQCKGTTLR